MAGVGLRQHSAERLKFEPYDVTVRPCAHAPPELNAVMRSYFNCVAERRMDVAPACGPAGKGGGDAFTDRSVDVIRASVWRESSNGGGHGCCVGF